MNYNITSSDIIHAKNGTTVNLKDGKKIMIEIDNKEGNKKINNNILKIFSEDDIANLIFDLQIKTNFLNNFEDFS